MIKYNSEQAKTVVDQTTPKTTLDIPSTINITQNDNSISPQQITTNEKIFLPNTNQSNIVSNNQENILNLLPKEYLDKNPQINDLVNRMNTNNDRLNDINNDLVYRMNQMQDIQNKADVGLNRILGDYYGNHEIILENADFHTSQSNSTNSRELYGKAGKKNQGNEREDLIAEAIIVGFIAWWIFIRDNPKKQKQEIAKKLETDYGIRVDPNDIESVECRDDESIVVKTSAKELVIRADSLTITNYFGETSRSYTLTDSVQNIFNSNGIKIDFPIDLDNIYASNNDNPKLIVRSKNDEEIYAFDNLQRISNYWYDNKGIYIEYKYDLTEEEERAFRNFYGLPDDVPINFIAEAKINGCKLNTYSVGEQNKNVTAAYPIYSSQEYANFPSHILKDIENSFFGTIIGPWSTSKNPDFEDSAGAYKSAMNGKYYIFVPNNVNFTSDYYTITTPLHEMAHIVQSLYPQYDKEIEEMFEKYEEISLTFPDIAYKNGHHDLDGNPSIYEFFADMTVVFFKHPDLLKEMCPDLYELMLKIYS